MRNSEEKKDVNTDVRFRLNQNLTLRDLITIVSVAVTIAIGWGVFSTRITVLEKEVASMASYAGKDADELSKLRERVNKLEWQQQYEQLLIERLYEDLKKPTPRRP